MKKKVLSILLALVASLIVQAQTTVEWNTAPNFAPNDVSSVYYVGIRTPGTKDARYTMTAFSFFATTGYGAADRFTAICTTPPTEVKGNNEGGLIPEESVLAISNVSVMPAQIDYYIDYTLEEGIELTGNTVYYMVFLSSNETNDGFYQVGSQRVRLRNYTKEGSSLTYPAGVCLGNTVVRTDLLPAFKATLTTNDAYTVDYKAFSTADGEMFDFGKVEGIVGQMPVPTYENYVFSHATLPDGTEFDMTQEITQNMELYLYYNPMYEIDYVVMNTKGETLISKTVPEVYGTTITKLPADLDQSLFYDYSEINFVVDDYKTIEVTATMKKNPLVAFNEDESGEIIYNKLILKGSNYLYYVDDYPNVGLATECPEDETAEWAFVGNPYDGFKIKNHAASNEFVLGSEDPTQDGRTGGDTYALLNEEGSQPYENWTLRPSTSYTNGFFIFNDDGKALHMRDGKVAYWTNGYDAGSTFMAIPLSMLSVNTMLLHIGNTKTAKIHIEGECSATSGNDEVATAVINGNMVEITGVAEGTTTITVTHNESGKSDTIEVTVTPGTGLLLNAENFPDANFREALASILGISEGDEITEAKIAATTSINVSSKKIANLTGIEHFTALTDLRCNGNQLTALDVSKNTALTDLRCYRNQLTSLDVSKNTALTRLYCYENKLTSFDVSKNTALTRLECYSNQLTSLDVSKNTALTYLDCENNQLTELDVSLNTALIELHCHVNQLTSLDVSKNTALTNLVCDNNQLTSLDVSKNTELTFLQCPFNQLTALDVSKNTALTDLYCDNNQLTALDVSKNAALEWLYCSSNQLIALDVSKNTALTDLACSGNQLTALDVSKNTALTNLGCHANQLTALDVSKNTALTRLGCFNNQIKGEAMDALVVSLPTVENGKFYVINTKDENEGNVCTKVQVAVAKGKGWKVYDYNGGVYDENYEYPEYKGSDDPVEDIDPVDEDDNIDFGNDMDENDDLDGNVIGDIFYNIGNGNGEYNAEEGCIVLKKTTNDETVDGLSGKDIFGEDFKGQFTGIVFKVPAGRGSVKVTAETTGNMLLKVKIGDGDPVEMELNGKLKISFPYNVSETTLVAIYAGANNESKGFGTTNDAEDAALKIYGIEFIRDETTAIDASLNDNGKMINDNYYSIDGKKFQGEPMKKGIYIYKGKKVKK